MLIYLNNNLIAAPSLEAIKLHLNLTFHLLICLKFQINKPKEINHHPTACSISFRDSWEATKLSVITNLKLDFNYKVGRSGKDMNYPYWNKYGAIRQWILNPTFSIFNFFNYDKILEVVDSVSSLILLSLSWNLILENWSSNMLHVAYSVYL